VNAPVSFTSCLCQCTIEGNVPRCVFYLGQTAYWTETVSFDSRSWPVTTLVLSPLTGSLRVVHLHLAVMYITLNWSSVGEARDEPVLAETRN
jgi:hypothetical protein